MTLTVKSEAVTYLVGQDSIATQPLAPYNDLICQFFADFSSNLLAQERAKANPDVVAYAFWCRKANIARLKEHFRTAKRDWAWGWYSISPRRTCR